MTARWGHLPKGAKVAAQRPKRRAARKGRWFCHGCNTEIEGTWASVERHVDAEHGAARVDCVLEQREEAT